jgi:hypothetical protein
VLALWDWGIGLPWLPFEVARDWLDYAEAAGALVSLLLAGIAAAFAWRSASDSNRSAVAAEQTAAAAAEEAKLSRQMVRHLEEQLEIERATRAELELERQRRPVLSEPTLSWLGQLDPGQLTVGLLREMGIQPGMGGRIMGVYPVIVRARFENVGQKVAEQVLVRCFVPVGVVPLESRAARRYSRVSGSAQRRGDFTTRRERRSQGAGIQLADRASATEPTRGHPPRPGIARTGGARGRP